MMMNKNQSGCCDWLLFFISCSVHSVSPNHFDLVRLQYKNANVNVCIEIKTEMARQWPLMSGIQNNFIARKIEIFISLL